MIEVYKVENGSIKKKLFIVLVGDSNMFNREWVLRILKERLVGYFILGEEYLILVFDMKILCRYMSVVERMFFYLFYVEKMWYFFISRCLVGLGLLRFMGYSEI